LHKGGSLKADQRIILIRFLFIFFRIVFSLLRANTLHELFYRSKFILDFSPTFMYYFSCRIPCIDLHRNMKEIQKFDLYSGRVREHINLEEESMSRRRFFTLLVVCIFCCSSALYANIFSADTTKATKQDSTKKSDSTKRKEWDVTAAHGPTSEVEFTMTEGTWMNLDVSPDGNEIVFDLLGDIYIMPIIGGAAKLLSGGPAF
jgi:hypothetical protein